MPVWFGQEVQAVSRPAQLISTTSSLSDFTWHGLQIRLRGAYFRRAGAQLLRRPRMAESSQIFASTGKARQAPGADIAAVPGLPVSACGTPHRPGDDGSGPEIGWAS